MPQPESALPMLPVLVVSGLGFEAQIAAGEGIVSVCGVGSASLASRLASVAAQGCSGILSFGTAGGLAPTLAPGDCVLADTIVDGAQHWNSDAAWLNALHSLLPKARRGALAGVTQPVISSAAKEHLWKESGALAVDMESHWAVQVAQRYNVPFAACRVIVDPAQRSLPSSATAGLQPDGRTAILPVLRALAAHPGELAALLALALDARVARNSLKRIRASVGVRFAKPM
ncbi:MAG: phosphorylase [Burkholderiales bacterium]